MKKVFLKQLSLLCLIIALAAIYKPIKAQQLPFNDTIDVGWFNDLNKPDANYFEIKEKADLFFQQHPEFDTLGDYKEQYFVWERFWADRAHWADSAKPGKISTAIKAMTELSTNYSAAQTSNYTNWKLLSSDEFNTQNLGIVTCSWTDPDNPLRIFIGTEASGLWRTYDGGVHWVNVTDNYQPLASSQILNPGFGVSSIDVKKYNNIDYICISTNLPNTNFGFSKGTGVLISNNDGASWSNISPDEMTLGVYNPAKKVLFDPDVANGILRIYASFGGKVYRIEVNNTNFSSVFIYKIFDINNYPNSLCNRYLEYDRIIRDMAINNDYLTTNPQVSKTLCITLDGANSSKLSCSAIAYYTTSLYQIQPSWTLYAPITNQIHTGPFTDFLVVDYCPVNKSFYFAYDVFTLPVYNNEETFILDKMTFNSGAWNITNNYSYIHNGNNFTIMPDLIPVFSGFSQRYDAFKVISPNTFLIGGFNITLIDFAILQPTTLASFSGGENDDCFMNSKMHYGVKSIERQGIANNFYLGNDGGISILEYTTQISNIVIKNINGKGLAIAQVYDITSSQTNALDIVYHNSLRNGIWSNRKQSWEVFAWGDGGKLLFDDLSTNAGLKNNYIHGISLAENNYLSSYTNSLPPNNFKNVYTRFDKGMYKYTAVGYLNTPHFNNLNYHNYEKPNINPPLVFGSNDKSVVYVGRHDIYKSGDYGTSWNNITASNSSYPSLNPNGYTDKWANTLKVIKVAPNNPNIMYIAFADPTWNTYDYFITNSDIPRRKLYKGVKDSFNNWQWTDLTPSINTMFSGAEDIIKWSGISDIAINPTNPDEIWIALNQYRGISATFGQYRVLHGQANSGIFNWLDMSQGLTAAPVNCIIYNEKSSNKELFIGTDVGIYSINQNLNEWQYCHTNTFPKWIVTDLEINYYNMKLRAATWGRGVWESDLLCANSAPVTILDFGSSSNITWNTPQSILYAEIPAGKTLTVKSKVRVLGNGRIIVKKGGKLIIDGGIIEACDGFMWQGITVEGDHTKRQTIQTEHGLVQIINGGTIKDAIKAIETESTVNTTMGGGVIKADNARFINNKTAICFKPSFSFNGKDLPTESYITNSSFYINDYYHDVVPYFSFITTDRTNMLKITNSVFENKSMPSVLNYGVGIGILSSTTRFAAENCTFIGLKDAIKATSVDATKNIWIKNCNFDKNLHGAYIRGINNIWITGNTFKIGNKMWLNSNGLMNPTLTNYGLYLDGCTSGYNVEGNTFENSVINTFGAFGMVINNSGKTMKTVNRNYFRNLTYAFCAYNDNNGNTFDANYGLKIKCNDFFSSMKDITVLPATASGVSKTQGADISNDNTSPAGNLFSQTWNSAFNWGDFDHRPNLIVTYYHHQHYLFSGQDRWIPNSMYNQTYHVTNYETIHQFNTFNNVCPFLALPNGNNPVPSIEELNSLLTLNQQQLNSAKLIYTIWVDNGNTQALKDAVDLAYPWEAYQIYNDLIAASPYLSDEVLIAAIENEDALPALLLKYVLLANPQAPRSPHVMDALYARANPLPDEWIDEIKEGLQDVALRDQLEANVGYYTQKRRQYFDLLKDYYLSDTTETAADSCIALMQRFQERENAYELALRYIKNNQADESRSLMNSIPVLYPFVWEEDYVMHAENNSFLDIFSHLSNNDFDYNMLSNSEKEWIINASNNNNSLFNANAINMRLAYDNEYAYEEPLYVPEDEPLRMATPKKKKTEKADELKALPNPANDFFIIEYSLATAATDASLIIYDALGKKIEVIKLTAQSEQKLIDCSHYAKGLYHCVLSNNGNIISTAKVSVIK